MQQTKKEASNMQQSFISFEQFASQMGICTATARKMVADGTIKAKRFSRRLVRIPASELQRLQKECL